MREMKTSTELRAVVGPGAAGHVGMLRAPGRLEDRDRALEHGDRRPCLAEGGEDAGGADGGAAGEPPRAHDWCLDSPTAHSL